jgi:hypothetical protein
VSLVVACITGFRAGQPHDDPLLVAWTTSARELMRQLQGMANSSPVGRHSFGSLYLLQLIKFLSDVANGYPDLAVQCVLGCEGLALEDRVAFAAAFLTDVELNEYLHQAAEAAERDGDIEGLILLGLCQGGLPLLQSYVDRHDDLQTAALLVGNMAVVDKNNNGLPAQWLLQYRELLNHLGLFLDRANLDVQLGRRYRLKSGAQPCDHSSRVAATRRDVYRQHPYSEAPHVFLRCHFCSAALPSDASQKQQQAAWQKKQGNILYCCSNCKKALPRCYVCLSHLGIVNPQVELNRFMMQRRSSSDGSSEPEHCGLPMSHWFLFCQLCKHGGHAECIEKWFDGCRSVCGVNGCQCTCCCGLSAAY